MDFGTLTKEQIDSLFTPVDFGSVTKEQIDSLFNTSQTPVSVPNPVEQKTTQPAQVNRQTIPTLKPNTSSAFKTAKQAEEEKQEEKKQTISRVGYSSNELRDMERAMNAKQEADNRRVNAYKDDIAPILGTANRTSPNLTNNARREIEGLEKELKDVSKTVSTGDAAVDEAANSLNKEKAGEIKRKISKIKKDGHASNEDYVVSKDKYNALTSDPELKKDIENLGKIEYRSQMAGVTVDPNVYSKTLTGKKLKDYYAYLTKKYGLSKKELKDMALTNQSEERAEKQEEYREKASQYAEEHPVKGSIASLGGTLGSGVEGAYNVAAGAITGDNRYLSNVFNNAKQGLREGAANNFDTGVGKTVYNLGMGLADLGAGVATGNAPLVLAGNTANEAMLSADERGTDTRKAALYGATSGVVDYITNTIGLDKAKSLAMEGIKSSGIKKFLANNAIAGLGEAGENLIQDLAQTALDELINGGNSELSTEYDELVNSGMSKDEALKQTVVDYLKDRAMSAGTGFLMGSAMQGIPTLTSGLYNKHIENNGKKVWNDVEKWETEKSIPKIGEISQNADIPTAEEDSVYPLNGALSLKSMGKTKKNTTDTMGDSGSFKNPTAIPSSDAPSEDTSLLASPSSDSNIPQSEDSVNADNAEVRDILTGLKNDLQDVYNSQGLEGLRNATNNINSDIPQIEEGTPDIPPSETPDYSSEPEKIRKTYKNTFVNAGIISPDELDLNPVIRQDSRYTPHKNSVTQESAQRDIEQHGEEWADAYVSGRVQASTDSDVDRAMTLLQDYKLSNYESNEIARNLAENGTKGGQFIQAFAKYNNTPVKAFVDAAKTINDQVKEWKSSNQKTVDRNERIAQILAQEKKPEEYQHIGKHIDEWNNEIDYYTMPENVRNEVKEIYSGMEQLLEAISRAKSTEEIDALTHKAIQGMNRAEELLAGNAHLEDTSARQYAKEQIKDFFKKVDGTKIQIPDRIRPEFTDMKIRDFNNAVYFGDKKSHIKFAKESGTPVDQIFEELDNSLNGALSSWCRAEGLNPDIDVNQINAIMGYCNDLKDARKRIDISPYEDYSGISKINKEVHRVANERQRYLDNIAASVDEEIENNSVPMDLQMFGKSKDKSTALQRALKTLEGEPEKVETEPPTTREIRNQVYNTLKDTDAIYDFVDIPNDGTNLKEQEVIRRWLDGEDLSDADKEVVKDLDYIAYMVGHGAGVNELREALNTKFATGTFGVSQETQSKVNRLFDYAKQFDTDSEDFVAAQAEAYRLLANDIAPKASALEKYDAWRYMAMLGNPKTMLRNWLGNKMFSAVTGVSNNLAAWGEERVDNAVKKLNNGQGIQRTKAILNPIEDRGLIDRAKEDARAKRFRQIEGTKYEKMDKDTLKQSRSVWNSKIMQLAEKAVDAGISDTKAVINKYATSLAGYMKANGMDESYFNDGLLYDALKRKADTQLLSDSERAEMNSLKDHVDAMEKARDYALKQAEYSTFHEDNKFAQTLTKWSKEARNSDSAAVRGLGYAIEGIVPFKKTPANILRSGIEYSPLGAIKSIKETGKLIYENTGKRKGNLDDTYTKKSKLTGRTKEINKSLAADVIDSWSKTLTGSALTALGYYLYNKGILHSNDEDTKYQERLEGVQNFSIEINGHTYTIDWMSPGAMPLFLGAEISKVRKSLGKTDEEWYNNIDTYLDAANSILNPIFETSMLSGIQDSLETVSRATADKNLGGAIGTVAGNALTGYATQGIPTLGGQIARTIDPERRSTYAENEGILGEVEKQGRKIANKLPFLSKVNQPYINQRGDVEYNSPFKYKENEPALNALKGVGNLAYQMLSPGYIDKVEHTPADKIGWDVYNDESTANTHQKDKTVFSQYRGSGIKLDGKKLTSKQQTKYERTAYKADDKIRTALANDKWFNSLDSSKKGDVLKDVNTLVGRIGQASVDPKYNTNDKLYNAYKKGGIPTLLAEFQGNNLVKQAGYDSDTKVAEQIQEAVKSGNTEKAMEIVDTSTTLKSLGLDKPYVPITYENAKKQFPDMSVETFAKQYKQIDGAGEKGKKNQSITQDEIIAYLNNAGVTDKDKGQKTWDAYGKTTGDNAWVYIPVLEEDENGNQKWVKKKK